MSSSLLPPKREVALALLDRASVFIHLDPRGDDVLVPSWFKKQPQLVLQVGRGMAVRIPDLEVQEQAVACTLSFNRSPHYCYVPWSAVYALVGEDGRGMVWPDDIPLEVSSATVAQNSPKLQSVPGGRSKRARPQLVADEKQAPRREASAQRGSLDGGLLAGSSNKHGVSKNGVTKNGGSAKSAHVSSTAGSTSKTNSSVSKSRATKAGTAGSPATQSPATKLPATKGTATKGTATKSTAIKSTAARSTAMKDTAAKSGAKGGAQQSSQRGSEGASQQVEDAGGRPLRPSERPYLRLVR